MYKGFKHTEESKKKMRLAKLSNPTTFWKGKKFTKEHVDKLATAHLGHKAPTSAFKKGDAPWNKGIKTPQLWGEKHGRWKGGKVLRKDGYILVEENGERQLEHRKVMEIELRRRLRSDEHVHHLDGNKSNNSINNLIVLSRQDHASLHSNRRWGNI